jgi:hypothetical protein
MTETEAENRELLREIGRAVPADKLDELEADLRKFFPGRQALLSAQAQGFLDRRLRVLLSQYAPHLL